MRETITTNWAGNCAYRAERVHEPAVLDELREVVARSRRVKVLGTRHSFSDVADTTGDLVSLARFDRILALDRDPRRPTVTVEPGVTYGWLCRHLHGAGYALANLASLPHISVAGAVATATHGSGDGNGNLSTAVAVLRLVAADGEMKTLSRDADGDTFRGSVVSLGGLGAVVALTLDLVPAFDVRQTVYERLPLAALAHHFDEVTACAYSVSLFTDWRTDAVNQVWLKQRDPAPPDSASSSSSPPPPPPRCDLAAMGATVATRNLHPIAGISADHCTEQLDLPGPAHERLPHFRMEFMPSAGQELQSEFFVPREHAMAALRAVAALRDRIAPLLLISEIRTIAADELWMSPCYRRASVAIHFTWKQDWPRVAALLPQIESALAPFGARPHWGKLFTVPPAQLQSRYPRLADFRDLLHAHDPGGKFRNAFLDRNVFGVGHS